MGLKIINPFGRRASLILAGRKCCNYQPYLVNYLWLFLTGELCGNLIKSLTGASSH